MKINILKSVTVVTPTIGSQKLIDAIQSVKSQTYKNVRHLLVIDGAEHVDNVLNVGESIQNYDDIDYMTLPFNVGANGFYGHRVYAAIGHLVNTDYVAFLDEDNWYDDDHIESLVNTIENYNVGGKPEFVYSYRKVWTPDKKEFIEDNCESLGMWPVWVSDQREKNNPHCHVDTSSYLFRRDFLERYGYMWHHGWGADRRFFQYVTQNIKVMNYSSFKHTLNYRLDGNIDSVNLDFFNQGNKVMHDYYYGYPWKQI